MKILVTGGCRSGKSAFALTRLPSGPKIFLATAQVYDDEMAERVARHQAERGPDWRTVEAPTRLADAVAALTKHDAALCDSLSMWVANVMGEEGPRYRLPDFDPLCQAIAASPAHLVFVTDEVGLGVVPPTAAGRRFRDLLGRLNQDVAALCDQVYLVACGLPLRLK